MTTPKRQRYPSSLHKATRSWSVSCRTLALGIHNDANGDEPRKTTPVLDTDVEKTLRNKVSIFAERGVYCGWEEVP
jgi:hypothetical protein